MSLATHTQLGNYEITGTLGAGGMGEVYRARDTKLGRDVAIKTLPSVLATDQDRLARFEREAKLLASLNHGHIASIYGLDEHDGMLYIAMELVDGESLEEKLKRGPLPVEEALRIGLQIAEALDAAHAKGVIHRDLKPANVMLTPDGVVKVLDFGLAKAFTGDANEANPALSPALSIAMTQAGIVLGTAAYMSPEQASGQATDQRADVWSFGVVMYEMLTGQSLFGGESVPHILADVLRTEPDWSRLPANLHPRIRMMLERCLTKRPRSRYTGIADARADIEAALQDPAGVIVAPASVGGVEGAADVKAPRSLVPWAVGLLLAIAAGAAAWTLKPAPPGTPPMYATDVLPAGQSWAVPVVPVLDITADGTQLAYNVADGIRLRSIGSFDSVVLPGADVSHAEPVFSPDGRSLAYVRQGPVEAGVSLIELVRVPATGGSPRPLALLGDQANAPLGLSWEADDTIVYGRAGSGGVWRVSANGGMPELIVETSPGEMAATAELLPGGDWVLFTLASASALASGSAGSAGWDTAEIVAQSISTGERRVFYSGGSSARYVPSGHLVFAFGATLYALPFDVDALAVTGSPVPVVDGVYRDPTTGVAQYAFSDNGTLIYVPGTRLAMGNGSLIVARRDGNIESLPISGGTYTDVRVATDGRSVAYTARYTDGDDIAVYVLRADEAPLRLTFGGLSRAPVWSADGSRVIFQSTRDGTPSLYSQLADGSGGEPLRLTTAADGEIHEPDDVSPDGRWLTFTRTEGSVQSIWILDLASGETSPLTAPPAVSVSQSVFSPDGRWLAYQSTETGSIEVFVQPFPSTGAKFQLPQAGQNHHPVWSADGRELFYFPGIAQFEAIAVTTEPRFGFGAVEALPNSPMNAAPATRRQLEVLPDGSGFVGAAGAATAISEQGSQVRIVQNWFEELERLAPTR